MFVRHQLDDGRVLLVESFGRPIVYLDNWALNDIALDAFRRDRFVSTMKARKGTLRLSVSNLVELMKQADRQQISAILDMIDSIDAGFINTNFMDVITRENGILRGEVHENPSQEIGLIRDYLFAQNWPESWTMSDVIRTVLDNSSGDQMKESWDQFAGRMEKFLSRVRFDPKDMSQSKERAKATRKKGKRYERPTRELFQLAFNFVLQNEKMQMNSNEWHDFFHSIVPVSYCDLVLLDKRWATFISQTGLEFPDVAFVFDKKAIDEFFKSLVELVF
ncbi:hypothetical protein DBT_2445 [Dissulfuribacter thermophilus]|uniref:Uncharacterized protein n=1 Tax=Dissulfuribacter thermophilus TaxID=1156395 RepID=A0A1B9F309_9BACT|nr:hypothetical protein [Dissulfuribacter thermophilus]OCC14141.1 hypothetical protein DBT_2445 [Dissulfuribacter thermophilus]